MRIHFQNLTRPKKGAKVLAATALRPLSACQQALARSCGYRDWHDLEINHAEAPPCMLDEALTTEQYIQRQVTLATALSRELGTSSGNSQYTLSASHLTGSRQPEPLEQLEIRIQLFRNLELPVVGRREKGEIGRAKALGPTGERVILRKFGKPTNVITNKAANGGVADFEYVSPRVQLPLFIPMRLYLIYGVWTEVDGAEVLYSRDYLPLWRIRQGCAPERMFPWLQISRVATKGFWDDRETPWTYPSRYKAEIDRLRHYRLPGLPLLVDVLPIVIQNDDVDSFEDAIHILKKAIRTSKNALVD